MSWESVWQILAFYMFGLLTGLVAGLSVKEKYFKHEV